MASVEFYELYRDKQEKILLSEQERVGLERKLYHSQVSPEKGKRLKMLGIKAQLENLEEYRRQRFEKNQRIRQRMMELESNMRQMTYNTERLRLLKNDYEEAVERMYSQWKEKIIEQTQRLRSRREQLSQITRDFDIPDQPIRSSVTNPVTVTGRERDSWRSMEGRVEHDLNGPEINGVNRIRTEPAVTSRDNAVTAHSSSAQPIVTGSVFLTTGPGLSTNGSTEDFTNGSQTFHTQTLQLPHSHPSFQQPSGLTSTSPAQYQFIEPTDQPQYPTQQRQTMSTAPAFGSMSTVQQSPRSFSRRRGAGRTQSPSPSEIVRMSMSSNDSLRGEGSMRQEQINPRASEPEVKVNQGPIYATINKSKNPTSPTPPAYTAPKQSQPEIQEYCVSINKEPIYSDIDDYREHGQGDNSQIYNQNDVSKSPPATVKIPTSTEDVMTDENSDIDSLELPDQTSNLPKSVSKGNQQLIPTSSTQPVTSSPSKQTLDKPDAAQPIKASLDMTASTLSDDEPAINVKDTNEFKKLMSGFGETHTMDDSDSDSLEFKNQQDAYKQWDMAKTSTTPISQQPLNANADDVETDKSDGEESEDSLISGTGMGYKPSIISDKTASVRDTPRLEPTTTITTNSSLQHSTGSHSGRSVRSSGALRRTDSDVESESDFPGKKPTNEKDNNVANDSDFFDE